MSQANRAASISLDDAMTSFVCRYDQSPNMQIIEDLSLLERLIEESILVNHGAITTSEALFLCQALFLPVTKPETNKSLRELIKESCISAMDNEKLHQKWGLDAKAMAQKLESLSLCQALAIWHNVKRFWVNPDWDHAKVAELFSTSDA